RILADRVHLFGFARDDLGNRLLCDRRGGLLRVDSRTESAKRSKEENHPKSMHSKTLRRNFPTTILRRTQHSAQHVSDLKLDALGPPYVSQRLLARGPGRTAAAPTAN